MKKTDPLILTFLFVLFFQPVTAQVKLSDSARISLLTASPWYDAVYAFFGHTAIRVEDDSIGVDAVFNYGYFDSSQPYFIYHFIRGETDYVLGVITYNQFIAEYGYKGQEVVEQELHLMPDEKQALYEALMINALPENRGYRYNYFHDNCATRPRDMIEQFSRGSIEYPSTPAGQSFRDLIHEHVSHSPWVKFGIDLLIGSDTDKVINVREKMYIPSYLMDSFEGATIHRQDTTAMPLVSYTNVVLPGDPVLNDPGKRFPVAPTVAGIALLIATFLISFIQVRKLDKARSPRIYDTILFGMAGVAGIIVFVLMYFSEHPATNPNWNLAWINPFALVAAILFWSKRASSIVYFYHFINFVVLFAFLLLWWLIPQQLPLATIPFAACLGIRSGTVIYIHRREKIMNKRYTSSRTLKRGWEI